MKTKVVSVAIVALLMTGASVLVWVERHQPVPVVSSPSAPPKPAAAPAAPKAPLDPMTIEAMRQRAYTASAITVVRDVGTSGGVHTQVVSYQSDGNTIYALLDTPTGTAPAGGWPVIIFNHGYIAPPAYSTTSSYATWASALAKGGFIVIKPDYRGNGTSQGTPEGGHFSPAYAYDALNLVASAKNIPGANASRLGMFGHSMGGHETLRADVVSKNIKASVIAAGVVGSFNDFFYNWPNSPAPKDQPTAVVQGNRQKLIDKYGTPQTNPDFWNSASSINYVAGVAGPIQVHHGTADAVVPQAFSDHLVSALQAAGKPVEYYTYAGGDHNFSSALNLVMQRSIAFYQAHL